MDNDTKALVQELVQQYTREYFLANPVPLHTHNDVDSLKLKPQNALENYPTLSLTEDRGNSGSALEIIFAVSNVHKVTLTNNCTFTFSKPIAGGRYLLELLQDSTGSRTVTWPSNVKWSGGVAPTLTTTAGRTDIITFYYNGTNYAGASTLNYIL